MCFVVHIFCTHNEEHNEMLEFLFRIVTILHMVDAISFPLLPAAHSAIWRVWSWASKMFETKMAVLL